MRTILALALGLAAAPALAHDFAAELARFDQIAATKDLGSQQAVEARIMSERAQGELEQAETRLLLRVRALTNSALREAGGQPAFLTSEIRRLEAAIEETARTDPAVRQRVAPLMAQLRLTKAAYDALDRGSSERMQEALRLIEAAPNR